MLTRLLCCFICCIALCVSVAWAQENPHGSGLPRAKNIPAPIGATHKKSTSAKQAKKDAKIAKQVAPPRKKNDLQDGSMSHKRITYKDMPKRVARDHFIAQIGYMNWTNKPSTMDANGVHRQVNLALMYDFLIKGFPYMSIGIGIGAEWDNMYFRHSHPNINSQNGVATFNRSDGLYYQRSKFGTIQPQVPLELRFTTNPLNYNKGFKVALGIKVGYVLRAYTKGVQLKDARQGDITIVPGKTIVRDHRLIQALQPIATLRIGWGPVHIYGTYAIFPVFNANQGPAVNVWSIGIGINGL